MSKIASSLPVILASALVLGACATGPRKGPPAPVERYTPLGSGSAGTGAQTAASRPKPVSEAQPPKGTQTYAYREPGTEPEPAPMPQAPAATGQPVVVSPTAPPVSPSAPVVQGGATRPPAPVETRVPTPVTTTAPPTASAPVAPPPVRPQTAAGQQVAVVPPSAPARPGPAPRPAESSQAVAIPGLPPAADALARQAEQQRQMGDYAGSAATLERALRIAPREAYLWNRLARVRMEQGLSAQAGQLASRSNDLGASPSLRKDNWRIIAESKRRAGDMVGAGEAEKRAGGG